MKKLRYFSLKILMSCPLSLVRISKKDFIGDSFDFVKKFFFFFKKNMMIKFALIDLDHSMSS